MTKKSADKLITTTEFVRRLAAEGLKRTPAAITKAARTGRLADTVQRGPRGELLFHWPAARDAFKRNTDTTRARPAHLAGLVPARVRPPVDLARASACDELTTAFIVDLWLKVSELAGFNELEEADQQELQVVFATALDGMTRYGVPACESPWPPRFDPQFVAEVCRD